MKNLSSSANAIFTEKNYDLLLMPTTGHEPSNYATHPAWDYLVEHLQEIEPPKGFVLSTKDE